MSCRGLFITGTDTGVGKTHVASAIVRRLRMQQLRVGAYKPTVSGSEGGSEAPFWGDVESLFSALEGEFSKNRICPQCWHAPLAPPVAARREGGFVDAELLRRGADWWRDRVDYLIVEGAGGLLSPLTETESVADLARDLGFPLLIVARMSLGTINHTLLTLNEAVSRKIPVAGILLNQAQAPAQDDISVETNAAELQRRTAVPILGILPFAPHGDLLQTPAFHKIDFVGLLDRCLPDH
jgi:dethiobiotin synthetase